jgi:hypothetical protein
MKAEDFPKVLLIKSPCVREKGASASSLEVWRQASEGREVLSQQTGVLPQ